MRNGELSLSLFLSLSLSLPLSCITNPLITFFSFHPHIYRYNDSSREDAIEAVLSSTNAAAYPEEFSIELKRQDQLRILLIINAVMVVFRILGFVALLRNLSIITKTLTHAFKGLSVVLFIFAFLFVTFSISAHGIFGVYVDHFSTYSHTFVIIVSALTGHINLTNVESVQSELAVLFFVVFYILFVLCILDIVLAFIVVAWLYVWKREGVKMREGEIMFLVSFLFLFFPLPFLTLHLSLTSITSTLYYRYEKERHSGTRFDRSGFKELYEMNNPKNRMWYSVKTCVMSMISPYRLSDDEILKMMESWRETKIEEDRVAETNYIDCATLAEILTFERYAYQATELFTQSYEHLMPKKKVDKISVDDDAIKNPPLQIIPQNMLDVSDLKALQIDIADMELEQSERVRSYESRIMSLHNEHRSLVKRLRRCNAALK